MAMTAESLDLPLFPAAAGRGEPSLDPARRALDRSLARGKELERRAALDPSFSELDRRRLLDLERELRGLRDCYDAARHPRVRRALLDEAARLTRRMKFFGSRLCSGHAAHPQPASAPAVGRPPRL